MLIPPTPLISPRGKFFCVCLLLLPYKLGAKCSKVTRVEKGDKDKWIQTSCYTSFMTWFKSCNGAGEVPEWIRLKFQMILYLVTTGVSHHLVQRKMHWCTYMDFKISMLRNEALHFSDSSWADCTTCSPYLPQLFLKGCYRTRMRQLLFFYFSFKLRKDPFFHCGLVVSENGSDISECDSVESQCQHSFSSWKFVKCVKCCLRNLGIWNFVVHKMIIREAECKRKLL